MEFRNALNFLSNLKENNQKEWFHANKSWYNTVKKEWEEYIMFLIDEICRFDTQVCGLNYKKAIFRINRDIRFTKDKRPYKHNLGAYIAERGRRSPFAGYYFHLQPGNNSFLGGGLYKPANEYLNKAREEIDYNFDIFKSIINSDLFKKYFNIIEGEQLKTSPKNYHKNNPAIEYLRYKSILVTHSISDHFILNENFTQYALTTFKAMKPFNDFFNKALKEVN